MKELNFMLDTDARFCKSVHIYIKYVATVSLVETLVV